MSAAPGTQFLGAPIKVSTIDDEELEGELFCYDVNHYVVLRQERPNGTQDFKWIRINVIREVKSLGPIKPQTEQLPPIDLAQIAERAAEAEAKAEKLASNQGVGVTQLAQEVFDFLSKTMDCSWDKEDIICFGVRIKKPYSVESCSGENQETLARVKKVLEKCLEKKPPPKKP
mmetsp:Transcript_57450/g.122214  ORF Transcript_57450/g.122214 Transcript_57450/m.122214 type:complete len:173 (-) Transcript_57450:184-702(-)